MSLQARQTGIRPLRFPRVSGDEPVVCQVLTHGALFSPRERG